MKNIHYIINGVLAIAVVILFIMQFSGQKAVYDADKAVTGSADSSALPIAYFHIDKLLQNYNFARDLDEQITRKQENARANLTQQMRNLESEVNEFRYKMQNGAFLTQARAEQEQERLMKKQQDIQSLDQKLTQDLLEENQRVNEQLRDTIMHHLKEYNMEKKYQVIISSDGTNPIFYADESYDITNEIVEFLNKKWSGKEDKPVEDVNLR
ncbi:MAG: OmpH family outer membrane protein [Tannerella sp.]|jgi:outer membrane protein|nr:OmpH family outer membrane protein [Tannerella sp.]